MRVILSFACLGVMLVGASCGAMAGPGAALSFNGTNQYVRAAIPALAHNYTVSAWVYLRSGGTDGARFGVLAGTDCGSSTEFMIHSVTTSASDPQILELGRCNFFSGTFSTSSVPLNAWTHIAVTISAAKDVRYYINGLPAGSWNAGANNTTLGPDIHLADNVTRHFNGLLDEVQIWSRALTQGEIQANMYGTPDIADSGLVAYWPMVTDGGSVLTPDVSGHGRTGWLINQPAGAVPNHPWPLSVNLLGGNTITGECHAGFSDPGAYVSNTPFGMDTAGNFAFAIKKDGTIAAWGQNTYGQTSVPASATNVVAIAAGEAHALALRADGSVVAWGYNNQGQTNVPASATNLTRIAGGNFHSLALRADRTALAWGDNSYGQSTVPASATNLVGIAGGLYHSLALAANGVVVAWGRNDVGQLNVPAAATNVVAVAAGNDHNLALRADGRVVAWGYNSSGQTSVPASATSVVAIAAGGNYSLALRANGTVIAWGDNTFGQTAIPATVTNVAAISAGGLACQALRADGSIINWGAAYTVTASVNQIYSLVAMGDEVDTNSVGSYAKTYTAKNTINTSTVTRTVVIVDTTAPVLTLLGSNPMLLPMGTPFNDPGATAFDACGGDFTSGIVVTGTVDTNAGGIYTLTYAVADTHGNTGKTQRTVWVTDAPSIFNLSAVVTTTNALTGTREARLYATVNPNGLASTVFFEFGLDAAYAGGRPATNNLPAGYANSNLLAVLNNLGPGMVYHWRVVATNMLDQAVSSDQVLEVPSPYARGDFNGNGIVEDFELDWVYEGYWQNNPTVITNALGMGKSEVKLAVDNMLGWDLTAQYSDDLATWSNLSVRAVPVFEFTDSDATNHPTRMYRVLAP